MNLQAAKEIATKVTAYFETGDKDPFASVSGNFDGQGVSFGPFQFCLGQGSLQPILKEIEKSHPAIVGVAFGPLVSHFRGLLATKTNAEAVAFVQAWHSTPKTLKPEWVKAFAVLGSSDPSKVIVRKYMATIQDSAWELSNWITENKSTVRSYCLAHDITVQNGGIGKGLRLALAAAHIPLKVYRGTLDKQGKSYQWAWLSCVAGARCLMTRILGQRKFFLDVVARKFLIVDGEDMFRGQVVNLAEKYGVTDESVEA